MYDRWARALLYVIKVLNVHAHKQFNFGRDRVSLCSISAINQSTSIWQVTWKTKTIWLALIDKKVRSASLQLVWRVRLASRRRSYSGHGVNSKQETSGSSCTSRLIIFEEHPSDTQRVPYGVSFWNRCILPHTYCISFS